MLFKRIAKFGAWGIGIYIALNIILAVCMPLFLADFIFSNLGRIV